MVFDETQYVESGERYSSLVVEGDGYIWTGILYERNEGGFDLYLDYDNCEFESLAADKITWLRQQAGQSRVLFIGRFMEAKVDRTLVQKAGESLVTWLRERLGISLSRYKCRQPE